MPDTRGDVLCPTCGLWTPPAPFCTECGAALQLGLQESASGGGSDVFRRGREVGQPGAPWDQSERFEPEPEDEAARNAAAAAAASSTAGAARVDHFAEIEAASDPPWPAEPGLGAEARPVDDETHTVVAMGAAAATAAALAGTDVDPAQEPAPPPKRRSRAKAAGAAAAAAAVGGAAATEATPEPPPAAPPVPPPPIVEPPPAPPAAGPPVTYAGPPQDGDDGNSGVSGLVFVLFLGLGILALLGGAMLGGVFDGGVAEASPTPTATVSTPSPEPSPTPSASVSTTPSSAPSVVPIPTPAPAPDGFIARAEPCDEQPSSSTCDSSGAENSGDVWILVSFRHAKPTDVLAVTLHDESGTTVAQSNPITLAFCGTNTDCAGYTFFDFHNLGDGDYEARVTRNGTQVGTTEFTVN